VPKEYRGLEQWQGLCQGLESRRLQEGQIKLELREIELKHREHNGWRLVSVPQYTQCQGKSRSKKKNQICWSK